MTFAAFEKVRASKLNREVLPGTVIAQHRRETNSSGASSTSNVAVLRILNIPLTAGRMYKIETSPLRLDTGVANDVGKATLLYTTDGTTPTTSSPELPGGQAQRVLANVTFGTDAVIRTTYTPGSDETLALLLCVSRPSGTGSIVIIADGASTIAELTVTDAGEDPGDTGTDL